jgi:universal stress protein E
MSVQDLERIIVAVEQNDSAKFVLEKAEKLALAADAELHVIRVIYDANVDSVYHDASSRYQIRTYLMEAEETWLEDFVGDLDRRVKLIESATIWNKDEYAGILDAADESNADIIIKAAHEPGFMDTFVRTPQDWNLLRHADIPVMLVKPESWHKNAVVLAAIDALDEDQAALNGRLLKQAGALADTLGGEMDIVVAHPFVDPFVGPNTVPVDFGRIQEKVEKDIRKIVDQLSSQQDVSYRYLHVEEGSSAVAVAQQVEAIDAEILVMGTVARDGVKGIVLGNTSETILYRTRCDVAVLR